MRGRFCFASPAWLSWKGRHEQMRCSPCPQEQLVVRTRDLNIGVGRNWSLAKHASILLCDCTGIHAGMYGRYISVSTCSHKQSQLSIHPRAHDIKQVKYIQHACVLPFAPSGSTHCLLDARACCKRLTCTPVCTAAYGASAFFRFRWCAVGALSWRRRPMGLERRLHLWCVGVEGWQRARRRDALAHGR